MPGRLSESIDALFCSKSDPVRRREASVWLEDFQKSTNPDPWTVCLECVQQSEKYSSATTFFCANTLKVLSRKYATTPGPCPPKRLSQLFECCSSVRNQGADKNNTALVAQLTSAVAYCVLEIFIHSLCTDNGENLPSPLELLSPISSQTGMASFTLSTLVGLGETLLDPTFLTHSLKNRLVITYFTPHMSQMLASIYDVSKSSSEQESHIRLQCAKSFDVWVFVLREIDSSSSAYSLLMESFIVKHAMLAWLLPPAVSIHAQSAFASLCKWTGSSPEIANLGGAEILIHLLAALAITSQQELSLAKESNAVNTVLVCMSSLVGNPATFIAPSTRNAQAVENDKGIILSFALACLNPRFAGPDYPTIKQQTVFVLSQYVSKLNEASLAVHSENTVQFVVVLVTTIINQVLPIPEDLVSMDFEAWLVLRDSACELLADCALIIGHEYLMNFSGQELEHWITVANVHDPVPWTRVELCLYALTTIAHRAPAGQDRYIPAVLPLLPKLNYATHESVEEALLLRAAAVRLVLWTAGYVAEQLPLFLSLFNMCLDFFAFIAEVKTVFEKQPPANRSIKTYAENVHICVVETISAICLAMATKSKDPKSVNPPNDEHWHDILQALNKVSMLKSASLASRLTLVASTSSMISCLRDREAAGKVFDGLLTALENQINEMESKFGTDDQRYRDGVKLLFVAFKSFDDSSISDDEGRAALSIDESLVKSSPLLSAVTKRWESTIERHMNSGSEYIVESCAVCLSQILIDTRWVIIATPLFGKSIDLLCATFIRAPTVYHLSSLRRIVGCFGAICEEVVLEPLKQVVETCQSRLAEWMLEGRALSSVSDFPDLLGMCVDTLNIALLHPALSHAYLSSPKTPKVIVDIANFLHKVAHPKVQDVLFVLLQRIVDWSTRDELKHPEWILSRYQNHPTLLEKWKEMVALSVGQARSLLDTHRTELQEKIALCGKKQS